MAAPRTFKQHGLDLREPVLQPNTTRFEITEGGGFDVGERTFAVDSDALDKWRPSIHTPDSDLQWLVAGGQRQRGRHSLMFVSGMREGESTNGITFYTVLFLGLVKRRKPRALFYGATKGQYRTTKDGEAFGRTNFVGGPARFTVYESLPTVNAVEVVAIPPDPGEVGTAKRPPLEAGARLVPGRRFGYAVRPADDEVVWEGWVLSGRTSRRAGILHEKSDHYAYERTRRDT